MIVRNRSYAEEKGAFYTPKEAAESAIRMIARVLGDDWQERYYTYDPCVGKGFLEIPMKNTTKLIGSTLDQPDIDYLNQPDNEGNVLYPGATFFQADFLNDDIFERCPKLKDIHNERMVILMNPPFAVQTKSMIEAFRRDYKFPATASQDIQVAFIVKAKRLFPKALLCFFHKVKLFNSNTYKPFIDEMDEMYFTEGELFHSSIFVGTKGNWPVALSCFIPKDLMQDTNLLPKWFTTDCTVFNLFAGHNQTSSFTAEYKGKTYFIDNQFYPFHYESESAPTFVCRWLEENAEYITPEAKAVLEIGKRMYDAYQILKPQLDLAKWKIENNVPGWYQIRNALNEKGLLPDMFMELKKALSVLTLKIRHYVYAFGFLPEESYEI